MIGEIQISSNVATYYSPAALDDLRCINYIFGANGTGKTTITRVIEQADGHAHCQLHWKNGTPLQTMVYNRDFVERNFNEENTVQGVFTLGDNQVEAEREITLLQPDIEKITGQINGLKKQLGGEDGQSGKCKELQGLEPVLRDKCWKQKLLHDSYFKEAFAQAKVRGNGEKFKVKVLAEKAANKAELLLLEDMKEKASTIFSSSLEKVSPLSELSADALVTTESDVLLQKRILGNQDVDIAALIERLGNSDWVKQGLQYHGQEPTICPFCQQSTDEHFAKSLVDFFSEAYDEDVEALSQLLNSYRTASQQLVCSP